MDQKKEIGAIDYFKSEIDHINDKLKRNQRKFDSIFTSVKKLNEKINTNRETTSKEINGAVGRLNTSVEKLSGDVGHMKSVDLTKEKIEVKHDVKKGLSTNNWIAITSGIVAIFAIITYFVTN
jgi:uncharacterized protein YdcH (DUF465 family)